MILYTEQQLLIAYTRYVRQLQDSLVKVMTPTIEEFRTIYETELEEQLWDEIND
jgi:hypothetical protein